jgi:hypothetical protein
MGRQQDDDCAVSVCCEDCDVMWEMDGKGRGEGRGSEKG